MSSITLGKKLPTTIEDASVLSPSGESIKLAKHLDGRPTALVFIRHFGCIGCSVHMTELSPRLSELHDLGLNTIIVGNGANHFIEGFMSRYQLPEDKVTVLTDPTLELHKKIGLKRSFFGLVGLRSFLDYLKALLKGHGQRSIEGDNFQQGGTILLDEDRIVRFAHFNQSLGDHADTCQIVDSIYGLLMREGVLYR